MVSSTPDNVNPQRIVEVFAGCSGWRRNGGTCGGSGGGGGGGACRGGQRGGGRSGGGRTTAVWGRAAMAPSPPPLRPPRRRGAPSQWRRAARGAFRSGRCGGGDGACLRALRWHGWRAVPGWAGWRLRSNRPIGAQLSGARERGMRGRAARAAMRVPAEGPFASAGPDSDP
jgi:hypothetical protein